MSTLDSCFHSTLKKYFSDYCSAVLSLSLFDKKIFLTYNSTSPNCERSRHQSEYAFLQPSDAFKLQMTNGEREGEERRMRRRHGRQGLLQLYEELHAERETP